MLCDTDARLLLLLLLLGTYAARGNEKQATPLLEGRPYAASGQVGITGLSCLKLLIRPTRGLIKIQLLNRLPEAQ